MSYRHVRNSRDVYNWVGLVLSALAAGAFTITLFHRDPAFSKIFMVVLLVVFLAALGWFLRAIAWPFELEVVVEETEIRWGRADRPAKQQRVQISQIVRLLYDKKDCQILGDVGKRRYLVIGTGILMRTAERDALLDHLRQHCPKLKIESR
jgi:hypothetical protein